MMLFQYSKYRTSLVSNLLHCFRHFSLEKLHFCLLSTLIFYAVECNQANKIQLIRCVDFGSSLQFGALCYTFLTL